MYPIFSKTLSRAELFENAVFAYACGRFSKTLTSHYQFQSTSRNITNLVKMADRPFIFLSVTLLLLVRQNTSVYWSHARLACHDTPRNGSCLLLLVVLESTVYVSWQRKSWILRRCGRHDVAFCLFTWTSSEDGTVEGLRWRRRWVDNKRSFIS